jgi:hypothetical protein
MPRKHTASFILELPLKTGPGDDRACAIILDAYALGTAIVEPAIRSSIDSGTAGILIVTMSARPACGRL